MASSTQLVSGRTQPQCLSNGAMKSSSRAALRPTCRAAFLNCKTAQLTDRAQDYSYLKRCKTGRVLLHSRNGGPRRLGLIRAEAQTGSSAAAQTSTAASDAEALKALNEAASLLAKLDTGFLKSLPQDLQADAKFSGFQLASGPLDREVGGSAADALSSLGRAFEALDAKAAASAAGRLAKAAGSLPPRSSQRAKFGQRLAAFAGPLRSGDKEELKKIAQALSLAGQSLAAGAEDKPVPDAEEEPKSFGGPQGVSPVFVGVGLAAALLVVFAQLASKS